MGRILLLISVITKTQHQAEKEGKDQMAKRKKACQYGDKCPYIHGELIRFDSF